MGTLWQDIGYGIRILRKSPGFTAIALVTLAIGIGANTIMFSVTDVLLLRPLGVKEPQQLVCCGISDMLIEYFSYLTISDSDQAFSDFMAQDDGRELVTLAGKDKARQVRAMFVSGNYFSFLGVVLGMGRGFLPEEDRQGTAPVVVLSHLLWQRQGADPDILDQSLRINGVPCQVIGVAPEGFTGITLAGPDLWLPMGSYLNTMVLSRGESRPPEKWRFSEYPLPVIPIGRLKPGVSRAGAQASLHAVAAHLKARFRNWPARRSLYLYPVPRISTAYVSTPGSGTTYNSLERLQMTRDNLFLLGISGTILVIACFNLANMLIIRGTDRCQEIAVRLALGGSRLRIIRQLLIESLLLALLGGVLGLILASWGTSILNNYFAASQQQRWRCIQTSLSIRVLGMTLGISVIATLLFGLKPALGLSRRNIIGDLKKAGSSMLGSHKRRRGGLSVFCQIMLTAVLVMIAVMFTRCALLLTRSDDSFNLDNTLVVELDPFSAGYDRTRGAQVCATVADHLESLPGIDSLGMSPSFYFGQAGVDSIYAYIPGAKGDNSERLLAKSAGAPCISRDYFPSIGFPLLQGRFFTHLDSAANAEKVVIIDEYLARRIDPNSHVLGTSIRYNSFGDHSEPYRIIGIVPNIPSTQGKRTFAQTYIPAKPNQMCPFFYLRLQNPKSAEAMEQRIIDAVREIDPHLPVLSITTLGNRYRDHKILWFTGMCVRLTSTAGAIALFLAALGIWAAKGYMVASRTREIGIRKALGATQREIMGMVFKEGLLLTVVGLVCGLLLGLGATRVIASVLSGYHAAGPIGIALTVALLGIVSLLAGYGPTRKAAKIDPMEALRYE